MSNLSTLPKGDSAWLLRKAIERIIQQVSVLETNIGSSTTGNSANTQVIFNDNGVLRGAAGLTYNKTTNLLTVTGAATITGAATVGSDLSLNGNENYVYLFSNYSIGNNSRVRFRAVGAGGGSGYGGDFRVSTRASNNTWNTDVLTIDSSANCIWTDGAGGTRMTLNSTGLGVGVASPNARFHSKAGAVTQGGIIETTGANALLSFADAGTSSYTRVQIGSSGNNLAAFINSVQAMTLDASGNLILLSSNTPATLTTNGQLTVNATSNTNLRFSYRGSDGVTRVANITLA